MTTTIERSFRFEAAHMLPNVPPRHKCGRLHGHSYTAVVEVCGEVDPAFGWIMDFAEIDRAIEPLRAVLDHSFLNRIEGLENPTSETLAQWIFRRLEAGGLPVASVTVRETCTSAAKFRGPL